MPEFKQNVNLSEFSNYKIGGPARFFFEATRADEVGRAVLTAKERGLDLFVLGGGTNLLIDDNGFKGLVLKPSITFVELSGTTVTAGAGVLVKDLLAFAAKKGLSGLEWAGGLPGTLGGAIRGNAGAFGGEIKDVIHSVESFDTKKLKKLTRHKSECFFGYRTSVFKEKNGEEIILSATFALKKGDSKKISEAIQKKIDYRLRRHPMEYPNVGSIFKNVDLKKVPKNLQKKFAHVIKIDPFPVVPTAYLISEAGLKGISYGGAMISPKHPNFIVNVFGASTADVKNLIALVKKEVHKKFKIILEEEVQLI
ncbi:MAG: UDP-N-acetylmuramate dehydrogenase [bacterium]|nr:UDP-N-acetylmuramate dehydrogenase [bacterium]